MKTLFSKLLVIASILTMALSMTQSPMALAQTAADVCEGLALTGEGGCVGREAREAADQRVSAVIRAIINILSIVVGVLAVIFIIIGGLKYVTSSGDTNNTQSAKNTILYALVGLVIVVLAQVLVRFVLSRVA